MSRVTVRDLRNHSAELLQRVGQGERVTVTNNGRPVAEVIPLRRTPVNAEELVDRYSHLPPIDEAQFKEDIDSVLDASL